MLYVGLTGGIASGKSVVAGRLAENGCAVLDLDRVAHEVMAPTGPAYADVVAAFGVDVLAPDGTIDRKRLGARVFRDGAQRERLNAIVHPSVLSDEARRVTALESAGAEVVVSEAALLVETGLHLRFDRLVVADCSPEQQRLRLERRNGIAPEAAEARLAAQMPADLKVRFAHRVIDTSGSLPDTERNAAALAQDLLRLARRPPAPAATRDRLLAGLALASPSAGGLAARFIDETVQAGRLDLRRTARIFGHAGETWYQPGGGSGHAPVEVALPVVVHLLSRRFGDDPDVLASALASVGRSLCDDPSAWADGCAFGLAAARLLVGGAPLRAEFWPEWVALVERWTGGSPRASCVAAWRAASTGGADPAAAASQTADILSRLAAATPVSGPSGPLRDLCERFLALTR